MKRIGAIFEFLRQPQRKPDPEPLTPEELAEIERGEADLAAGRVVPHEKVRRWLESWGKPDELPAPRWRR